MLVRIVKLRFRESEIPTFLANFEEVKNSIRAFPGCQFLELYRDQNDTSIFFTYSYWDTAEALGQLPNLYFQENLKLGVLIN